MTLNYDTILERHLTLRNLTRRLELLHYRISAPATGHKGTPFPMFRQPAGSAEGVLAKLHGSVDWLTCPNDTCPHHAYIFPNSASYRSYNVHIRGPRCTCCGWEPKRVIIPPTAMKPFENFPKLNLMWLDAYEALRRAERWTFTGVSFAQTDFHLSALLRSASSDAIHIGADKHASAQLCVVGRSYEGAENAAVRLLNSLTPGINRRVATGAVRISVFESVEQYLRAVEETDSQRVDWPPRAE